MNFTIECEQEQEDDHRWLAEIQELPGVMVYGDTLEDVVSKVEALALCVIADRLEHGEPIEPIPTWGSGVPWARVGLPRAQSSLFPATRLHSN